MASRTSLLLCLHAAVALHAPVAPATYWLRTHALRCSEPPCSADELLRRREGHMRAAELLPEGEPAAAAAENSTSYWKRLRRRWRIPAPIQDYRYLGRPNSRPIMDLDELHTPRYTSRDWARNILTMPMSRILRRITSPLMFNLCVSLSCLLWHRTVGLPTLSSVPHTLLGSALGLLLVFRTNTAYDRYWEARRRWGEMVDEARAFGSLACTVLPIQHAEPLLSLIASFPWVLKNHLRCERSSRPLRRLLANETFEALIHSENQPLFLLAKMRRLTHASKVCADHIKCAQCPRLEGSGRRTCRRGTPYVSK